MGGDSRHQRIERKNNLLRKLDALDIDTSGGLKAALREFQEQYPPSGKTGRWTELNTLAGSVFSEVFQYELDCLENKAMKKAVTEPAALSSVIARAHDKKLAGLAISGGGIRSATFNLGVLQALARLRLLKDFDYMSTVSGGGYIGGWLSKWIKEEGGDVGKVQQQLGNSTPDGIPAAEPAQVQFLRRYSNYLTPAAGMFSADTWTLIATYCRNTLLNMSMLLAWLAALFLLPRAVALGVAWLSPHMAYTAVLASVLFLWTVHAIAYSISRTGLLPTRGMHAQTQGKVLATICIPLMGAAFFGSIALSAYHRPLAEFWRTLPVLPANVSDFMLYAPGLCYFVAWAIGWGRAQVLNAQQDSGQPSATLARRLASYVGSGKIVREGIGHFLCAIGALTLGTVLLLQTLAAAVPGPGIPAALSAVALASLGMPMLLILFGITITLMIGLIGRLYSDQSREWWSRQGAWTTIFTGGWLFLFLAAFYLPPLLDWAYDHYGKTTTLGAAVTSVLTFLGLKSGSSKATGKPGSPIRMELAAQLAPYAFTLLIVAGLTATLQYAMKQPITIHYTSTATEQGKKTAYPAVGAYFEAYIPAPAQVTARAKQQALPFESEPVWKLFLICLGAAVLLGLRVDINKFSLYMMYRLRLVRAYLGASNNRRQPHPFTGFDPADDPKLSTLLRPAEGEKTQRPYHLINAALNLVGGKELAWQKRKAANFCFSPGYCGFEMPAMSAADNSNAPRPQQGAFRPTDAYAAKSAGNFDDDDAGVKLGMAVAVSGAAASPNMGYHSSPPLTFLMTLFNLRLGRWCPNPMRKKVWTRSAPHMGLSSILSELFGLTSAEANFLYLSDGGHFENLGVYELVKRRCRLIVVIDASCDGKQHFDDLGNAIRKCATDLNILVKLDAREIRSVDSASGKGVSFVKGCIKYSHADGSNSAGEPFEDGVLLYIKPIIEGYENADVFNYSKMHPEFPHQTTADQWFDEDQFESYRALGCQICLRALESAVKKADAGEKAALDCGPWQEATLRRIRIEAMCRHLSNGGAAERSDNVVSIRKKYRAKPRKAVKQAGHAVE